MTDSVTKAKVNKAIEIYRQFPIFARAKTYHRTHKNQRIEIKPGSYLEAIYKDKATGLVIIKSTQCGISEYLLCRVIYRSDIGRAVLYVLPTDSLKNQFVSERVNKSVMFSPQYKQLAKNMDKRMTESLSMKQFGKGVIVFTGSNSANAFVSYPADDIVVDEYDTCDQVNLEMAPERQAASKDKTTAEVGNPTFPKFGIDAKIRLSDNKFWKIKCQSCGERITPDYFEHIVDYQGNDIYTIRDQSFDWESDRDILPICKCGKPFDRFLPGEWVPTQKSDISGYNISKMFSSTVTMRELVQRHMRGLESPGALQRFYNGDLGRACLTAGTSLTRESVEACIETGLEPWHGESCIAGVDVGSVCNIVIGQPYADGKIKIVWAGTSRADEAQDLADILKKFNVRFFVIDAMPETRFSKKVIALMSRRGLMCHYAGDKSDIAVSLEKSQVSANRTMALDAVKEGFTLGNVILPPAVRAVEGFFDQLTNSIRSYDEDKNAYYWVETGPDHYFHAFAYLWLAKRCINLV